MQLELFTDYSRPPLQCIDTETGGVHYCTRDDYEGLYFYGGILLALFHNPEYDYWWLVEFTTGADIFNGIHDKCRTSATGRFISLLESKGVFAIKSQLDAHHIDKINAITFPTEHFPDIQDYAPLPSTPEKPATAREANISHAMLDDETMADERVVRALDLAAECSLWSYQLPLVEYNSGLLFVATDPQGALYSLHKDRWGYHGDEATWAISFETGVPVVRQDVLDSLTIIPTGDDDPDDQ